MRQVGQFGTWLKRCRAVYGLTQAEFAAQLRYATITYRKIEYGSAPSRAFAERVADFLHLAPAAHLAFLHFASTGEHPNPMAFLPPISQRPPDLSPTHRVPAPPNRLIGREAELQALHELLADQNARLITLTGGPGVGKTRLALELGQYTQHPAPIFYVPLTNGSSILAQIADVLSIPPHQALFNALQHQNALLILDPCEQLLANAPEVAALLDACPHLRVLAVSQCPLRLRAERVLTIEPLDPQPALELLLERWRARDPALHLSPADTEALIALSRELDGLPLALELAACWANLLSPPQLLERLRTQGADLLCNAQRDHEPHHHDLRTAFERSIALLTSPQRRLLAQLAARPTWTLPQAEALSGPQGLALLSSLVEHQLVMRWPQPDGSVQLGLLGLLRGVVAERTLSLGDAGL
jgi:transcriptional regulator with XRE-family HTH domain